MINSLTDSGSNMYLFDSLEEIDYMKTGSFNITLRKVNAMPYRFDKMFMDKDLIKNKFYQIMDQFDERKITSTKVSFESFRLNT